MHGRKYGLSSAIITPPPPPPTPTMIYFKNCISNEFTLESITVPHSAIGS